MSDALVLLQKLEDILTAVNQGAEDDYLSLYRRLVASRRQQQPGTGKDAKDQDTLNPLGTVRLFLAQYFARCAVLGRQGTSSR